VARFAGQEGEMDLDALLAGTADGACAVGGDGKIALWNRSAEKILGHAAREVVGRACCEVFLGRDASGNRLCYAGCRVLALVRRGEPVQHFDMATRTKTGQPIWLNVSILVVPGSRPETSTTVQLFRDVTASRAIETLVRERLAQSMPPSSAAGVSPPELTRRELEVLRLVAGGANTGAMAERLHVSLATVRNHVQHILAKLGVHSRLEAAAYAVRHRLV
jgi:PAS domain S-box-containing protein